MSSLNLRHEEDGMPDAGEGKYSKNRAFDILQKYLQPNSDLSVKKVTSMIANMLPGPTEPYKGDEDVYAFGGLTCEIAEQIPYQHSSQMKLVRLLQRLALATKLNSVVQLEDGYATYRHLDGVLRNLPEWREPAFADKSEFPNQFQNYINLTAFIARLSGCGFDSDTTLGLMTLRDALEQNLAEDPEEDDSYTSAAAMWILFAGQTMFSQLVQLPSIPEIGESNQGGSLYQGPKVGIERWRFWKKAFSAAAEREAAGEQCRDLATRAADLMASIERNTTW